LSATIPLQSALRRPHSAGRKKTRWVETEEIIAEAYDQIIPGFDTDATNTLRLWSAQASSEINLGKFNQGDYFAAVEDKNHSENVSRVLYPDDSTYSGRELRLRQEYFLVSATVQDILSRHYSCIRPMTTWRTKLRFTSTTPTRCCRYRS
jgi:glucan phosphorylase